MISVVRACFSVRSPKRERGKVYALSNLASGYNRTRDVFGMAHSVIPIASRCGIRIQTSPTGYGKKL